MTTHDIDSTQAYRPDDEIDLRELVKAIWDTRWPVMAAVIGFTALFWLAVVALGVRSGVTYSWDAQVQFTFEGVEEGIYPDETPFDPSDMLSPIIVQRVFEQNQLDEHGLTLAEFSNALSVEPFAPTREFIVQRFRGELQQASGSAQINSIQQEFAEALEVASRAYALITLNLEDGVSPTQGVLDDRLVRKVLLDVPKIWARYMTEQAGVFAESMRIYSAETIESGALGVMDGIVSADIIRGQFDLLERNIDAIEGLANSGNVRDPETGLRLGDIKAQANWLENFVLESARVSLVADVDTNNPRATARFFEGRMAELIRERDVLLQRAQRVESALDSYNRGGSSGLSAGAGRSSSVSSLPDEFGGGTTISQFGSDFISRLIELGSNAADLEFRQELTQERLDYTLQSAEVDVEIARVEALKAIIDEQSQAGTSATASGSDAQASSNVRLAEISSGIRGLVASTERLAERLNALRYGGQAAIYTVVKPPGEGQAPALILTRSNLQRFVLGAFLVALVTVMLVFLVNMLRSRADDEPSA